MTEFILFLGLLFALFIAPISVELIELKKKRTSHERP